MPYVMNRDFGTFPLKTAFPMGLARLSLIASRCNESCPILEWSLDEGRRNSIEKQMFSGRPIELTTGIS
jgi:hypothetical protein